MAKVGEFLVGFAKETEDHGGRDHIFVGKLTKIDRENNILHFKTRTSTKDPWTRDCLDAAWHTTVGKQVDKCSAANVVTYFQKLISGNKMPKPVRDFIKKHKIQWTDPGSGDDSPGETDPEYSA